MAGSYSTSDFKKGLRVLLDGEPYIVVDSEFMKPGKGQAVYRLKCKNLVRGNVVDKTYRSGDKIDAADVAEKSVEFSYKNGPNFVFMDTETYDQYEISGESLGDVGYYLLEQMKCQIVFFNDLPISVTPPNHVELRIEYCEPGARGNTATNVQKPAKLETGLEVFVPSFINQGDTVKIDTRTGEYVERISKA